MLCCAGLIGGMAIGQSLGGPWTVIAPAAGFGMGLVGDMKFMKKMHHRGDPDNAGLQTGKATDPVCGMDVDENRAEHQAVHLGKKYAFCAAGCKRAFAENPGKYIGQARKAGCCG